MEFTDIAKELQGEFGEAVVEVKTGAAGDPHITITPGRVKDIAMRLRDDEKFRFDYLMCLSGVDAVRYDGYWCPHDSEFLNWRYRANPERSYVVRSVWRDEVATGFSVLRLDGARASHRVTACEARRPSAPNAGADTGEVLAPSGKKYETHG